MLALRNGANRFILASLFGPVTRNFLLEKQYAATAKLESGMSFEAEKQKFLTMPLEEKRSFYKMNPVTLDQVPTWLEYWNKNKSKIGINDLEKLEKVDEELAKKVSMWKGDITALEIDAIVNAANSSLLGGGGVDGAIHRAAGENLKKECATLGGCGVGEAKITGGYALPTKHVIHTVGPQQLKPEKLTECYQNSLALVKENKLRSVAFPCIATGVYGYPRGPASEIAVSTVKNFLLENKDSVDRIIFCVFIEPDITVYEKSLQERFSLE